MHLFNQNKKPETEMQRRRVLLMAPLWRSRFEQKRFVSKFWGVCAAHCGFYFFSVLENTKRLSNNEKEPKNSIFWTFWILLMKLMAPRWGVQTPQRPFPLCCLFQVSRHIIIIITIIIVNVIKITIYNYIIVILLLFAFILHALFVETVE